MAEKQLTYEEMLAEVEDIITQLQSEGLPLDRVVSMVKRGYVLINELKQRLDVVSLQITEMRDHSNVTEE